MKVYLIYPDRDMSLEDPAWHQTDDLIQDLGVQTLLETMANQDDFLYRVAQNVLFAQSSDQVDVVRFRQAVLRDFQVQPSLAEQLNQLAHDAIGVSKKSYFWSFSKMPSAMTRGSVDILEGLTKLLRQLRELAVDAGRRCESAGLQRFFAMVREELDTDYFETVKHYLKILRFPHGERISATLGTGVKGTHYTLLTPPDPDPWWRRLFTQKAEHYSFKLPDRDEAGGRFLSELRDRGLNGAANVLFQAARHILDFFAQLRTEVSFYLGGLNLKAALDKTRMPLCFPEPHPPSQRRHQCRGLYDPCLALQLGKAVVANDLNADKKVRIVITGANQGGKSTFLRAVGLAQLMAQAGLFTPAEQMTLNLCDGLFTHYKREEDHSMRSGKLDEELQRMSAAVRELHAHSLLLSNESFAVTNQAEGAEILHQVADALAERHIKVFYVTHLYDFARDLHCEAPDDTLFLRAQREEDGSRSFKVIEGEPLATSYGPDLFERIFNTQAC